MSPAPESPDRSGDVEEYAAAWGTLMDLVRSGHSWSGRERTNAYLNTSDRRSLDQPGFVEISAVAGLDHADDGRALGIVDWDRDGDLDLWFRNRTAPRLRLMLNQVPRPGDGGDFVALRLEGTTVNRDAIGAVVTVTPRDAPGPLVRSVRAGDLFLSQSSKWLHFGLEGSGGIDSVAVRWPGGAEEEFTGLVPGGRFRLVEGTGTAEPVVDPAPATALGTIVAAASDAPANGVGPEPASPDDGTARILLPARIPLPTVDFRDAAARPSRLEPGPRPRLVLLWSAGCPHCGREMEALAAARDDLEAAGLDVLALSVDALEGPAADASPAYDLIDRLAFPCPWGLLDADSAARIGQFQAALFDRTPAAAVPLAVLVDPDGDAVAIYRGPVEPATMIEDAATLAASDDEALHHLAPPLAGTWFTNPMPAGDVAEFMARQFQDRFPEEAQRFLGRAASEHYQAGVRLAEGGRLAAAEERFRRVLELAPDSQAARESLATVRELRRQRE